MTDEQYYNDFTLEELELIRNNLHWNDCAHTNQKLIILDKKLGEMIANYCEHELTNTYDEREYSECSKCGFTKG